jgi:hypothetical protein
MADQLVFDGSLSLLSIVDPGVVTLTGTVDADYGTDTATGSISLTAAGVVSAATYTNLTLTQNISTGVYTLTGSNTLTSVTITYTGETPTTSNASVFVLGVEAATGTPNVTSTPICYAHGTHILTDRGEVLIENLKVGDLVVTPNANSPTAEIRWIGRQHFEGNAARFTQPILVRAGALGEGLPHRDLRVSHDHCLHLDGRLVPAKLLVNGASIVLDKGHEVLDYVNIELDRHSVILAEGIESESYLDCGNRSRFHNADEGADWVASRPAGSDAAWHDGRAVTQPLWDCPALASLVERIGAIGTEAQAKAA